MFEVTDRPITAGRMKLPEGYNSNLIAIAERDRDKLTRALDSSRHQLKQAHPELSQVVDATHDVFYGAFVHPDIGKEVLLESEKVAHARIQHGLVHLFVYAEQPQADHSTITCAYKTAQVMESLGRASRNYTYDLFWAGTKGELAVAKLFLQFGYRVWIPDYLTYPLITNDDGDDLVAGMDEVRQLDVRNGIDLLAEKGGEVWLIDAKTRPSASSCDIIRDCTVPQDDLLTSILAEHRLSSVHRATVIVNNHAILDLEEKGPSSSASDYQKALNRLGQIAENNRTKLLNDLMLKRS